MNNLTSVEFDLFLELIPMNNNEFKKVFKPSKYPNVDINKIANELNTKISGNINFTRHFTATRESVVMFDETFDCYVFRFT